MLENIIITATLVICAFFIGRRYYKQWRSALNPKESPSCCSSCSCCSVNGCDGK